MGEAMVADALAPHEDFRHEAFFYDGDGEFLDGACAFIEAGTAARQPVLVVVSARKIDLLKASLRSDANRVRFADMGDVGDNPARIIPAWSDFVEEHEGRPLRGIGEPIGAQRSPDELVECQRHESLLNVAFAGTQDFRLLCPYDTATLDRDVLAEARHSHPFIRRDGVGTPSAEYRGTIALTDPFTDALPEPPGSALSLEFGPGSLPSVRSLVSREARRHGLGRAQAADMVIALNEIASNTVRHAGGHGVLRIWPTADALVSEVSDDGHIEDPLLGRIRPDVGAEDGRGLWIANQLCDLVQVRSTPTGSTVRMHFRRRRPV